MKNYVFLFFPRKNQEVNISHIIEDGLDYTHGIFSFNDKAGSNGLE